MAAKKKRGRIGRPRIVPGEGTTQVAFRLSDGMIAKLDAYAAWMSDNTPGLSITRADAVRVLLTQALGAAKKRGEIDE